MTTLDEASKRLAQALDTLEQKVAAAPATESQGGDESLRAEVESLKAQLSDLTAEYDSLLERYDSLVERNLTISDRLDGTIERLRNSGYAYADS
jgi:chromosome segregation ATPase